MRRLSSALVFFLVPACSGGASPLNGSGAPTSSSTDPTSPSETDDGASSGNGSSRTAGVCADYIACVAKKAPEILALVNDAYGKNGSCWSEMSAEACDAACTEGIERQGCDECDPTTTDSCLGLSCWRTGQCAKGEVCLETICVEDALGRSCEDTSCPSPFVCKDQGEYGKACVLVCMTHADCPSGTVCSRNTSNGAKTAGVCL